MIILVQLWVAGEGPTIEWSYLQRKIVREKRLSFRDHGDLYLIVLNVVACLASCCLRNTLPSPSMSDVIDDIQYLRHHKSRRIFC